VDWSALWTVAVAIAVVDDAGHVCYRNQRWQEADPGEGFRVGTRYDAGSAPALGEGSEDGPLLDEVLAGGQAVSGPPLRTPDGRFVRRTEVCPLTLPDGHFLLVHKHDLTAEGEAGEILLRHAALLEAIGFAAAQFLSAQAWTASVQLALDRLADAAEMSRASLLVAERPLPLDKGLYFSRTSPWSSGGTTAAGAPGHPDIQLDALGLSPWLEAFARDEAVCFHEGEATAAEQRFLAERAIAALVVLPVRVDGVLWGLLLCECESRRDFNAVEVGALHAASRLVGATVAHRRAKEAIDHARKQEEQLRAQRETLLELQTPLIPLFDDILVVPLIGKLERERVARMLERLLQGVVAQRARTVLIDVTGVPQIEPDAAAALSGAAQAVGLLGARVMLTGINPAVACSLVAVDSDLRHLRTFATLESALLASMRSDRRRGR
jgi:anti-anti-sigma regulatory factor